MVAKAKTQLDDVTTGTDLRAIPDAGGELVQIATAGVSGQLEWLRAADLEVDHTYQREASAAQVKKIARDFDPDAFGVITVSVRANGQIVILDGQHRIAALMELERGNESVPCLVYRGLTIPDEARLFYLPQTTRRAMTPAQRFRARLEAGEANAKTIVDIVESYGFTLNLRLGTHPNPRELDAVAAVENVWNRAGGEMLPLVLGILRDAWGDTEHKVQGNVILGLATFLRRYEESYDRGRLVKLLRPTIPSRIERNGKEIATVLGGRHEDCIGRAILRLYNHKLQSGRLPEWELLKPGPGRK